MIHTPMGHATTVLEPLDGAIGSVRGGAAGHVILEYGDYECPYSRQVYREIQRVEQRLGGGLGSDFATFRVARSILTRSPQRPPPRLRHCRVASGRCTTSSFGTGRRSGETTWVGTPPSSGLDLAQFDRDCVSAAVMRRIGRDVESGLASGEVRGTPTLVIDGVVHRGGCAAPTLLEALPR
jgi:hypothetical protein